MKESKQLPDLEAQKVALLQSIHANLKEQSFVMTEILNLLKQIANERSLYFEDKT